jgi:imidazolonepropionase-like amidohydrolase
MASALPIAAAGLLARIFGRGCHTENFRQQVERLGFTPEMTSRLIEKTEEGTILLCVHAHNEAEAAVAWHIFHHVAAENIMCPADHQAREPAVLAPQFAVLAA